MLSAKTLPAPKIGTEEDIERFRNLALDDTGWKLEVDKSYKDGVKVWRKSVDFSPIDTIKIWYRFKGLLN